jgi:hypothetical protein
MKEHVCLTKSIVLMTKLLHFLMFFGVAFTGFSQRNMDLKVEILSPQNNASVQYNQMVYMTIRVTNLGNEQLTESDSLYIYTMINGDTLVMLPDNINHTTRTGISIDAGEDFTFQNAMLFSEGTEWMTAEWCVGIMPVNGTDPITETTITDNQGCIYIIVVDEEPTAGIDFIVSENVIVSPNPAQKMVSLNVVPDNGIIQLTSMDGKQLQLEMHTELLDVSSIPDGVYLLRFYANNEVYTNRMIVAK